MRRFALSLLALAACELSPIDVEGLRCDEQRPCGDGFECNEGVCVVEGSGGDAGESPGVDAGTDDAGADAGADDAGADAGADDAGVDAGADDAGAGADAGVDAGVDGGADAGVDAGLPRGVNLLANPGFETTTDDGGIASWRSLSGRLLPSTEQVLGGIRSARLQSTAMAQSIVLATAGNVSGAELGMVFCAWVWLRGEFDAGTEVALSLREQFADAGINSSSGKRLQVRPQWVQLKEAYATIGRSEVQLRLNTVTRLDAGAGIWVDDAWLFIAPGGVCP